MKMTTSVRFFLSHDFSAHRLATGHFFHRFFSYRVLGYIKQV